MKTLDELYREVMADDSLKSEYIEAAVSGRAEDFLRAHGCDAAAEELAQFIETAGGDDFGERASGELSDDELDDVAAGKKCGTIYHNGRPVVTALNSCDRWRCYLCGCSRREKHKNTHTPGYVSGHCCNTCKYYKLSGALYLCEHPARRNN